MTSTPQRILVVDDDAAQRELLGGFIASLGFRPEHAESAEEALRQIDRDPPQLVLLDVRLPGMSGIEALVEIRKRAGSLPVLLITAHADLRQAVSAMKCGADDYLAKPIDLDELEAAIFDMMGRADGAQQPASPTPPLPDDFVCESPAVRKVVETAAVVAASEAPVLILGPSGAGKEIIARLIHRWSPRAQSALVTANCAGLPETLIESELFGHTRGAFTGAEKERTGLFRAADGGTLFLDEIGELPLHLQPKLLRALESREITPVGGDAPMPCDVRLLAATNRDLTRAVADGRFREDLFYRLNVIELYVPPLSQRCEDILPLAGHFAKQFAHHPVRLSPQAMHCMLSYGWPGNVRQLCNAVQRACLLCRGDVILPEHLPPNVAALAGEPSQASSSSSAGRLSQVERATILATLAECHGNRTHAAQKLGISRRTLIYKLRILQAEQPPT